ncbi:hypothetical protein NDU88_011035 [Pleurodeles waltl]|uniref:Uncharacterized protein n=1 Tax=Pleurodeles waltl TaxID=8319 RepID=A0AAV7S482_PLEWA|nr:hypothetical protein NDU88_011035 [Pleurodeles waltl]
MRSSLPVPPSVKEMHALRPSRHSSHRRKSDSERRRCRSTILMTGAALTTEDCLPRVSHERLPVAEGFRDRAALKCPAVYAACFQRLTVVPSDATMMQLLTMTAVLGIDIEHLRSDRLHASARKDIWLTGHSAAVPLMPFPAKDTAQMNIAH